MIRGSIPAIVTPMQEDGALDLAALRRLLDWHIAEGSDAVVVVGTTGESPTVDMEEHCTLIRVATEHVAGRIPVIAGTGANSTREAVELAQCARAAGASAHLSVVPYYNKPTQEGLFQHFKAVAEAVDIPILLYNVPPRTGGDMQVETVIRLSQVKNIVGIKDSSGDLSLLSTYLNAQTERFAVFTGNAQVLATALRSGVKGGILAVSTFLPELTLAVYDRAAAGDATAATAAQGRLTPVAAEIVGTMGVAGVKAAHDAVGLVGGAPRSPLLPATDEVREQVKALIAGATAAAAR